MLIAASSLALVVAVVLLVLGVDPVPTWFYVFAWYPTLVLLDTIAHRKDGRGMVLGDPRRVISLCAWSAVIWLVFEAANFRLDNWYYVFLPSNPFERWTGILLAFGTVVPAILLAERALDTVGVGRRWRTRPFQIGSRDLRGSVLLGLLELALALMWPRLFFPLIWGTGALLAEPFVYRRRPDLSLFADISRGDWGRVGRLFVGGLGIGLLWESYNYWARGKWVYTVPWLENTKWFEMPPVGFIGFAFFALEAWAMYQALCAARVALPLPDLTRVPSAGHVDLTPVPSPYGRGEISLLAPRRTQVAGIVAAGFAIATLIGMERWTISSVVPRLTDLPDVTPARADALETSGIRTPFALATADPRIVPGIIGASAEEAHALTEAARLTVLRGIGTEHAGQLSNIGVEDTCFLAGENPDLLWVAIHLNEPRKRPTLPEVRVWIGGARERCVPGTVSGEPAGVRREPGTVSRKP